MVKTKRTKYDFVALLPHLSNQCLSGIDDACKAVCGVSVSGGIEKWALVAPCLDFLVWSKGLKHMLARIPEEAEPCRQDISIGFRDPGIYMHTVKNRSVESTDSCELRQYLVKADKCSQTGSC